MNQTRQFLQFFRDKGCRLTLGEIMKTHYACEYRKHMSLLRKDGFAIRLLEENKKNPSRNLYVLEEMQFEGNGQRLIV